MKVIDRYSVKDATHLLSCRHAIGANGFSYTMRCRLLGKTKTGFSKIIVFGDRYWAQSNHRKRIRYVTPWKLKPLHVEKKDE